MDSRLTDLGRRIDACIARHGFTERELVVRSLKRQIAALGIGRMVLRFDNSNGWKHISTRGFEP